MKLETTTSSRALLRLTKREIVEEAVAHAEMVRIAPGFDVQLEYYMGAYDAPIVWAVWKEGRRIEVRLIKGWDLVGNPDVPWNAILLEGDYAAWEAQELFGDGVDTLERDVFPPGLLRARPSAR